MEHKGHLNLPQGKEIKTPAPTLWHRKRVISHLIGQSTLPLLALLQEGGFGHYAALPYFVFSSLAHESLDCL